jgi:hypothetical protein
MITDLQWSDRSEQYDWTNWQIFPEKARSEKISYAEM